MKIKENNLYILKIGMSVINFIILAFISFVFLNTTQTVLTEFKARDFLENLTYVPIEPMRGMIIVFVGFFLLLSFIEIRQRQYKKAFLSGVISAVEIFLCFVVIRYQYFSYNGILLLVVADIVTTIQDKHNRMIFFFIMSGFYVLSDYNIVSNVIPMASFQDFLSIYATSTSNLIVGIRNVLYSINILMFVMYMVILMRNQAKENARIALLNIQLETANAKLTQMNTQLQDYAAMQEKMGETKERNRIAREIHDTLGHTMTGLSAGIDACIAMIDYSLEGTKKQLGIISEVARQGIQDIRRSVNKLRPDALEHLNLEEAIQKLIHDTMEVSDVRIHYQCDMEHLRFNADEEDMIYRVIQEGITNAIRHGKASQVDIKIQKENKWLTLSIKDDGVGCKEIKTGFGLIHIEERIGMLNGSVSYDGSEGFEIVAKIPIRWGENYD